MKILIVSDTHGKIQNLWKSVKTIGHIDMLIHLGDYVEDGIEIGKALGLSTYIVRGNGDYHRNDFNDEEILEVSGKKIFITHGHQYKVNFGLNNLYYKGQELGADYILFGHTHVPIIEKAGGMTMMNPGSPIFPRGYSRKKTFGIITIGDLAEEKILEIK